ncbi:MAG TPA: glycosyltransferase family 2 protein [Bryobacteraceae bacterium]|nr:glycosyltransferase family 2 protein [Bryobacteraceae bacterium]
MGRLIRSLSVAAPAYNEAACLETVASDWLEYLRSRPDLDSFEIVVCNDGSRDATGAILDALAARAPEVRPIHHETNQGAAAALTNAIHHTTKDWILLIDSDGQFPIEICDRMIDEVRERSADAVIGVRRAKADSLFQRFGSWLSGTLCNWFHGTHYRDFNCALKLVPGPALRALNLEAKGLNYSGEITSKLLEEGIAFAEVEVDHEPRVAGRSAAKSLKSAADRLLFVAYIGFRQLLFRCKVLQRPQLCR